MSGLDNLVPWTRPPSVLVYGPGVGCHGGIDEDFDCAVPLPEFKALAVDDMATRLRVLKRAATAAARDGRAVPGDFVVMSTTYRHNSSLVGYVIGADGKPVSTDVFATVRQGDVAPRMLIPAHLIPADADPAKLFAPLLRFSDMNSVAMWCLPDDSALLKALGCKPTPDDAFVFSANQGTFDPDTMKDMADLEIYPGAPRFYCVHRMDRESIASGWHADVYRDHEERLVFISDDAVEWFGFGMRSIVVANI